MAEKINPLDYTKMFGEFKMPAVPAVDVEAMMSTARRNYEAVAQANKLIAEGFQALAKRQAEVARASFEDAWKATQEVMNAGTGEAKAEKQAEVVKAAVEKAVANARELTELATKSQGEAFDVLNKRFIESVDEVKTLAVVK